MRVSAQENTKRHTFRGYVAACSKKGEKERERQKDRGRALTQATIIVREQRNICLVDSVVEFGKNIQRDGYPLLL